MILEHILFKFFNVTFTPYLARTFLNYGTEGSDADIRNELIFRVAGPIISTTLISDNHSKKCIILWHVF